MDDYHRKHYAVLMSPTPHTPSLLDADVTATCMQIHVLLFASVPLDSPASFLVLLMTLEDSCWTVRTSSKCHT